MIDTVRLVSPSLSENIAVAIEEQCKRRMSFMVGTGEVEWSLTSADLRGSWDSRVMVRVERKKWVDASDYKSAMALGTDKENLNFERVRVGTSAPKLVDSEPYLVVECSIHKVMLGHNLYGGSTDFQACCNWLIWFLGSRLGVELPYFADWLVRRIDTAEVFDLGSYEAVEEFFRGASGASYPRREVGKYSLSGIYAKGRSTTVKMYHKGCEFAKHDARRLKFFVKPDVLESFQEYANQLLRCEVEIKSVKLDHDFGGLPQVKFITDNYILGVYQVEMGRLIREGAEGMKSVRTTVLVRDRLFKLHEDRLAGLLFGMWMQLAALGEDKVKLSYSSRRTFFRHRKLLQDAGCLWVGTDVVIKSFSLVPSDFSPNLQDGRRISEVSPSVLQMLESVRVA